MNTNPVAMWTERPEAGVALVLTSVALVLVDGHWAVASSGAADGFLATDGAGNVFAVPNGTAGYSAVRGIAFPSYVLTIL